VATPVTVISGDISDNRRRFPRIKAPVFYRPAGPAFLHHRRATIDVGLGGMRVYSDEVLEVGARVELELLIGQELTVRCWARIAWVETLPSDSGAVYDMGVEFTDIADSDNEVLRTALVAV
jgi:c-di-GMP-binding flagellar brake protein YcgR